MKFTIEAFDEKIRLANEKRTILTKEIEELSKRAAEYSERSEAAANSGDVDLFIEINRQKEDINSAIHVKRTVLNKLETPVTLEDAKEAWATFTANYEAQLQKALKEFANERSKLLKMYGNLIDLQADACKKREHLFSFVDADNVENDFPMMTIPVLTDQRAPGSVTSLFPRVGDADLALYMASEEIKEGKKGTPYEQIAEELRAFNVVVKHSTK